MRIIHTGQLVESRTVVNLLGRTAELELIEALLAERSPTGLCLLLRGEPGIGKTSLLDAAAVRAEAAGLRVLHASGVESEAEISFSALHQLLYPLRERAGRLAVGQREVIDQIFDLAQAASLDVLVVSTAVLALLSEVSAECRVLLIVDDVPWLDRASATVLGFVARRLADTPVAFLATARTGVVSFFDEVRLPQLDVRPLDEQPAATLLDSWYPQLAPSVRRRLLDEAAGNPLALRELPAALTDRQRHGQDPLPVFLPLSGRLEAAFAPAIESLPAQTRHVLLLVTLEPDASLAMLLPATGRADVDDLESARQAGLVFADPVASRMSFRPPLIRSVIVQLSSPAERRAAHQTLADVADDPCPRAWHLAEAATGPDEAVAHVLEQAFLAEFRRGGAAAAVTALVRAAELSPQPADRSRRLIEAAYLASSTGPLDQVPRLLADARKADDARLVSGTRSGSVFAAATATYLLHADGDANGAYRLLTQALDDAATAKPTSEWIDDLLYALLFVCIYAARPMFWDLLGNALARFEPQAAMPLRLCYDAFTHSTRTSATVHEGLARAFAALPTEAAPQWLIPLAFAAMRMDALSDYRHLVWHMIERERDGGAIALALTGLLLLTIDSYHRGQWDEVETLAREGFDLAVANGYHLLKAQLRIRQALVAAARGNADLAQSLTSEVMTWAAPRGIGLTQAFARQALAIANLGRGEYEEAYAQTSWIGLPSIPGTGIPARWMVMDLVEADVRTGRVEEARAHVAAAQQSGVPRVSTRSALITAGAAALAAPDDQAGALFEAALSLPDADRWPWEHARVHLAYGQWLRRTRDTTRARLHLRAAIETFNRLHAEPWAQRARDELRATGVATATTGPDTRTPALTAQERQIATLAATGLTNKQIGQQLFLSHRTVGAHLHRIFPKLGITSRAALRAALDTTTVDEHEQAPRPASPTPKIKTASEPFDNAPLNTAESHNSRLDVLKHPP
ncbi:AAA family ATPase [Dactylosporangium sp. NPDC049140]|uniref:ATP-binding protein n=1 Tax=Dactylosporangium sp. NPDC049140 TaxID=3155647 RepID=UPI0033DE4FF0